MPKLTKQIAAECCLMVITMEHQIAGLLSACDESDPIERVRLENAASALRGLADFYEKEAS